MIRRENSPTAVKTCLGWVLSGPVEGLTEELSFVNHTSVHSLKCEAHVNIDGDFPTSLDSRLKMFWDLETLGIRDSEDTVR